MESEDNQGDNPTYWTDDLPICDLSGVGLSTNQVYRPDGLRRDGHEFEDRSFRFKQDDGVYLYGLFDGHNGSKVSSLAAQNFPAELLLGQLNDKVSDDKIFDILRQAFLSVEKEAGKLIDDALAEKCNLLATIPEGLSAVEQAHQCPDAVKRLRAIETELGAGTAALLALVLNDRLYLANVGCSRALLCTMDARGVLLIGQLNADHNLDNQSELDRLATLGLDPTRLRAVGRLGGREYTRTLGDISVKRGYRDIEDLSAAASAPLVCDPDLVGGLALDASVCFLALLSSGLHHALADSGAAGFDHVNAEIASMIAQQLMVQTTLNGVAQAVVDQVIRRHHDAFTTGVGARKALCQRRDDITLIVRAFNCTLNPSHLPPGGARGPRRSSLGPIFNLAGHRGAGGVPRGGGTGGVPLSVLIPAAGRSRQGAISDSPDAENRPFFPLTGSSNEASTTLGGGRPDRPAPHPRPSDPSHSSAVVSAAGPAKLDADGRIEAYVSFEDFHRALEALGEDGSRDLFAETEPKGGYEAIMEERESPGTPAVTPVS